MKKFLTKPIAVTCTLLCLGAVALVLVTAHAEPIVNPIQACYNNTNGALRRVNSPADCKTHETSISWNMCWMTPPTFVRGNSRSASSRMIPWNSTNSFFT